MTKIKLLYSYLYIKNTKNLQVKNNKIYDNNNKFVCGLSNIPINIDGIKIIIERNLIKNKQSKKIVNTYYEKNNIKVYIEFDTKNISILRNKDFLIKLLKNNYLNFLNLDKNLFDYLCINKKYHKELFKNYDIILFDQNIIQIYDLYIDLSKNIIKKVNNKQKIIKLNFNILYSDYLLGTIKILNNYNFKDVIVICSNNHIKSLWENNINNYVILTILELKNLAKNNFKFVIFCDLDSKILKNIQKKFFDKTKYKNYLYIYTNYREETILNFINKFYSIINLKNKIKDTYKITIQTLYNYSKCIIYHKFFDKLIVSKHINKIYAINNKNDINKLIKYIRFNIKNNYEESTNIIKCAICLEDLEENEFIYLNCDHKFCKKCVSNLDHYKLNCSICRSKITYFKKDVCIKSLFCDKKWYYIGDILNNILTNIISEIKGCSLKNLIFLENMEMYQLLNNILYYCVPNKFQIYNYKCIFDCNYIFDTNNTNKENINLFYLKNDDKLNKYNYLYLQLKNFYKNINLFQYTIKEN